MVNAGCRDKDLAHLGKHLEAFKVGMPAFGSTAPAVECCVGAPGQAPAGLQGGPLLLLLLLLLLPPTPHESCTAHRASPSVSSLLHPPAGQGRAGGPAAADTS